MAESTGVGKWAAGIAATVIAAVLIAVIVPWVTGGSDGDSSSGGTTPSPNSVSTGDSDDSPAERLAGDWRQADWTEITTGGVTLGMVPENGTLNVNEDGDVTWTVEIDDLFQEATSPTPSVSCAGRVSLAGAVDGRITSEDFFTSNMTSLRTDLVGAFCGGGSGIATSTFELTWAPQTNPTTLEMGNGFGTFVWRR